MEPPNRKETTLLVVNALKRDGHYDVATPEQRRDTVRRVLTIIGNGSMSWWGELSDVERYQHIRLLLNMLKTGLYEQEA